MDTIHPASEGDTQPQTFADLSPEDWGETTDAVDGRAQATSTSDVTVDADTQSAQAGHQGALTPAAETEKPGDGSDPRGPIPFDRHEAILAKEREKWQRVAGFAEFADAGLTPEQVREYQGTYQAIQNLDAGQFLDGLFKAVESQPELTPVARAWAERILGASTNGGGGADEEPQPDLSGQLADGTIVPQYSPARMQEWRKWARRDAQREAVAAFDQRIGPLEKAEAARAKQASEQAAINARAQEWKKEVDQLRGMNAELFDKLLPDVEAYMRANGYPSFTQAYNHILVTKHLPALGPTVEAQTVAKLQRTAAASSARPSAAAPTTPKEPTSFLDPQFRDKRAWE